MSTANPAAAPSSPAPLNGWLRWFRYLTWVGILVNLAGFVLPALFTPDMMETILGPGMVELSYLWVAAAGMLLLVASLFYVPAAKDPLRYHVYAWLAVAGRGVAGLFWISTAFVWDLPGPIETFWITDTLFCVVFLVLLLKGMPPEYNLSAANLARVVASWRPAPAANGAAALFRALVWLGVVANLAGAAALLFAPEWFAAQFGGTSVTPTFLWLGNCGMLLVQLSLFMLPAAHDPVGYHVYAWMTVAGRALGAVFWLWQTSQWALTGPVSRFWIFAGLLALAQGLALQRALPAEYRLGAGNLFAWLGSLFRDVGHLLPSAAARVVAALVLAAALVLGYGLWANLAKAEPDTVFADPAEQFKYGAIGLGQAYRVPTYLWNVMPQVCADLLPADVREQARQDPKAGWASLGLIYEDGKDVPAGFSQRHVGYPAVEPNCGLCHTASYRTAEDAPEQLILGGSAHELDLQSFQWFLYDCAASDGFTVENLMAKIEENEDLGWFETQVYRAAILPFAKQGLAVQRKAYQWQKSRPPQGRGRTDTFNPTKLVVFHMPDDGSIGTVDLPVIWNQRAREGMYLHWDGNNNAITERNFAAAMAIGASPYSVLTDNFQRVTDFVLTLPPPKFPYPVDEAAAERGWEVFQAECADCHAFGGAKVGTVTELADVGTDRHRLDSFTVQLVDDFHTIDEGPFHFDAYRKTDGYANLPIDGAWARAPYLHNGSVPTLWDLLSPVAERPSTFTRGSDVYDPERMGFVSGPPAVGEGFVQDASVPGNGNQGHTYGTQLGEDQKRDLIEYLKTL